MEQKHYNPLNNEIVTEKTIKCWGRDETSLLIKLYRDNEHTTTRKKQLWIKLSNLLAEHKFIFSPLQVENKWKSLGRVKNRRPSVTQIIEQSGKMAQIKSVKLEVFDDLSVQQNDTHTSHEIAVDELFLSNNQMERLNDDIEGNCMMSDDDLSSVSSREHDCKKGSNVNSSNSNTNNNHGNIIELKQIVNKFIDYYDERERNMTKYELRKIKLMEDKNRILSERNHLIKERNDILKTFLKIRNTK